MSVEEVLNALQIGQVEVKSELRGIRSDMEDYRVQNNEDHKEIKEQNKETITEVKRINGEGTQAGKLWRARFEGAVTGTRITTNILWALLGAVPPTIALVISIVEKW